MFASDSPLILYKTVKTGKMKNIKCLSWTNDLDDRTNSNQQEEILEVFPFLSSHLALLEVLYREGNSNSTVKQLALNL